MLHYTIIYRESFTVILYNDTQLAHNSSHIAHHQALTAQYRTKRTVQQLSIPHEPYSLCDSIEMSNKDETRAAGPDSTIASLIITCLRRRFVYNSHLARYDLKRQCLVDRCPQSAMAHCYRWPGVYN